MISWIGLAVGVALIVGTGASVVATLIVPRAANSVLTRALGRMLITACSRPVDLLREYEARDRFLALVAPLYLLVQLLAWLAMFYLGFSLVFWPWCADLATALRLSGSSMFTLGFASGGRDGIALVAITLCCAATGMLVVALQVSYLPALYSAFNRRETLVTMLESRGGTPVWGPEILARHVLVDIVDNLPVLYADWERWAADVAESHATYPVLMYTRSPTPRRSWLIALLAMLDAAAMQLALNPLTAPSECRLVLRMGFTCLRDLARVLHIPFDPDPAPTDPIALTEEEFGAACRHLELAGWVPERGVAEAWKHFRGWRINYESIAHAIAEEIDAPPAMWSGPRRHRVVAGTAPDRPQDRRPDALRQELFDSAARRRAARTLGTGTALPPALRAAQRKRLEAETAAAPGGLTRGAVTVLQPAEEPAED